MRFRKLFTALAIGTTLACVASLATAQQVYKWKDAQGVTHFSQTPPLTGTHYTKVHLQGEPDVASNPAPASAQPPATSSQQPVTPTRARAAAAGTQPNTPSNHSKFCTQLTSNISLLNSHQPVVKQGTDGKQVVMSDDQREQQLATARAQQKQYCSSKGT